MALIFYHYHSATKLKIWPIAWIILTITAMAQLFSLILQGNMERNKRRSFYCDNCFLRVYILKQIWYLITNYILTIFIVDINILLGRRKNNITTVFFYIITKMLIITLSSSRHFDQQSKPSVTQRKGRYSAVKSNQLSWAEQYKKCVQYNFQFT